MNLVFFRKGKKRSKATANAENLDSKDILETSLDKEKKCEEDEDKENLAAENLFGDPEVRGEDEEEDGKEEQQAVVSCSSIIFLKYLDLLFQNLTSNEKRKY